MTQIALRVGHGYDVHRFKAEYDPEQPLILAGVKIDAPLSLDAHSDGDLVLHALCDALLGAAALGDIGQHFPDTDPNLRGVDSAELLQQVMRQLASLNIAIVNVDITIVAQTPKLLPYRESMLLRLQELLALSPDQVNLKATTTEKLGYIGRKEGIACHCVALVERGSDARG